MHPYRPPRTAPAKPPPPASPQPPLPPCPCPCPCLPQWLKLQVGHAPPHLPEDEVKQMLCDKVDTYLHERIELADQAILGYAVQRIAPGDVLLVYSRSLVIEKILLAAHRQGVEYRVIVADAGPRFEGRDMVKRLLAAGVTCDYANLHAVSYVMAEVGKVLLGCSSMLLNGTLVGRAGTALIAMLAHERGVPVLVRTHAHMSHVHVHVESSS